MVFSLLSMKPTILSCFSSSDSFLLELSALLITCARVCMCVCVCVCVYVWRRDGNRGEHNYVRALLIEGYIHLFPIYIYRIALSKNSFPCKHPFSSKNQPPNSNGFVGSSTMSTFCNHAPYKILAYIVTVTHTWCIRWILNFHPLPYWLVGFQDWRTECYFRHCSHWTATHRFLKSWLGESVHVPRSQLWGSNKGIAKSTQSCSSREDLVTLAWDTTSQLR